MKVKRLGNTRTSRVNRTSTNQEQGKLPSKLQAHWQAVNTLATYQATVVDKLQGKLMSQSDYGYERHCRIGLLIILPAQVAIAAKVSTHSMHSLTFLMEDGTCEQCLLPCSPPTLVASSAGYCTHNPELGRQTNHQPSYWSQQRKTSQKRTFTFILLMSVEKQSTRNRMCMNNSRHPQQWFL